jgi:hypothetical protein
VISFSLSELPDVGNWFSSYEYHSPNLDSNFTLQESAFRRRGSQQQNEEEPEGDFDNVRVQDEGVVKEKVVQCGGTCDKDYNHNEEKVVQFQCCVLNFSFLNLKHSCK